MYVELTTDERAYREVAGWILWKLTGQLMAELAAEGITEPLSERITLACVLSDLYRLAENRFLIELRQRPMTKMRLYLPCPANPRAAARHATGA